MIGMDSAGKRTGIAEDRAFTEHFVIERLDQVELLVLKKRLVPLRDAVQIRGDELLPSGQVPIDPGCGRTLLCLRPEDDSGVEGRNVRVGVVLLREIQRLSGLG